MDPDRFDALSRALSTGHTRRRLTRLLGGLGVAGVLAARTVQDAIAAKLNGGNPCTDGSDCKTGKCLGSHKCSCSQEFPKCLQPPNPCKKAKCEANRCVTSNRADFFGCGGDQQCSGGVCATPPGCQNGNCLGNSECCSNFCSCIDFNPPFGCDSVGTCFPSSPGQDCSSDADCDSNNCVGFTCRAP